MGQILFVTKDMGAVNAVKPVADRLKARGHTIRVACEGLSTEIWRKAGYEPCEDSEVLVDKTSPDIVVSGLSRPINLEDKFSKAANMDGIPLVWVEDLWECHTRSSAIPNLIVTLDEVGERLIRMDERFTGDRTRVVASGNPAILKAATTQVSDKTMQALSLLRGAGLQPVLLAGQGGYTNDIIRVACASVEMSPGFVLIPRLHPKYLTEFGAGWKDQLDTFAARNPGRLIELDPKLHPTDDLARVCDLTLSTSSTTLLMAAAGYRTPVSILTEVTKPGMREIMTRLDHYPLVLKGVALEISEPCDLSTLLASEKRERLTMAQHRYFEGWDVDKAVEAIEELLPR